MIHKTGPAGIICLGASAGGLRSLEAIVSRLPADLPWPVLIAQHLQTDRISEMPAILGRVANMRVQEAADGDAPRAGTIYTCPSAHEMGVTIDGLITLRPPPARKTHGIDHLFATASYARPERTIAVVLSGTGSDGAAGALVVKLNHGMVIAESDASAQHSAMPAAAQRAGAVDATLPAEAIAGVLDDLARGSLDEATSATRLVVASIARHLTTAESTDFEHYRAGTIRRQAEKRRAVLGLRSLAEYSERLAGDAGERAALKRSLLIPVTEFFRDAAAWRVIEDVVVPTLARRAAAGETVRVWCVGCASGEEAYTIAILLSESIADRSRVQVLGTDLDQGAVRTAERGVFDATHMAGVDALRRERFFRGEGHGYRVRKELRAMVQFRVHDVTRDTPPGEFDLVICRNLLIYFEDPLRSRIVGTLRDALTGPRVLFLGRSEALPPEETALLPIAKSLRIFRRSDSPELEERAERDARAEPGEGKLDAAAVAWSGTVDARIEETDTVVMVVDAAWRILSANEHARRILDEDLVGAQLFDLFPRWQGSPVYDALRACSTTGRSLKVRGAPTPKGPMDITLERAPGAQHAVLLIGTPARVTGATASREALDDARRDLHASNDELQSANEELAATNEELQATNEELASLNEEFQSTNQTLASTNVELGAVAKHARVATELMIQFLQERPEALVACDAAQRVTLYNRKAALLFDLDVSCIGRPIEHAEITSPADVAAWLETARSGPVQHEVEHRDGPLRLTVEPVTGRAGAPLGWVLSWAAITT